MITEKTNIEGLITITPRIFEDHRGYFFESYSERQYSEAGVPTDWVQDNQSKSKYGVVRGLHYQLHPWSQAKLVRVITGSIYDVAVDMRKGSPTFGQWQGVELNDINKKVFCIPEGFAHGFSVLSEEAIVLYKSSRFYQPEAERGIAFNDPALNIDWKLEEKDMILTEKDLSFPVMKEAEMNF